MEQFSEIEINAAESGANAWPFAIAYSSAVLQTLLTKACARPVVESVAGDVEVSPLPPAPRKANERRTRLHCWLWRTALLPDLHNLPGSAPPQSVLDLRYLLIVDTKQAFATEMLLGAALDALTLRPVWDGTTIRSLLTGSKLPFPTEPAVGILRMVFTPDVLSNDSPLWALLETHSAMGVTVRMNVG